MPKVSKDSAAHVEQHGPVDDRHDDLDGYTVNFVSFAQDIDATPLLKGLPDDSCPCPHWGYVLEGRVTFRFTDREEVFEAGDAFYLPPGHIPVVQAGTVYVQFSPVRICERSPRRWPGTCRRCRRREAAVAREPLLGQQALLHGEQARRCPRRGADLRVDVLDVVGDRLGGDHKAPGGLLVGHPLGQQREDLDLAGGEARRPFAPPRHAMAGGAEDGLDGLGIAAAGPHVGP